MKALSLLKDHNPVAAHVVDVWRSCLSAYDIDQFEASLSSSERTRARSIISGPAQRRFIVGRAKLRQILSKYCAVEPHVVPILESTTGKPYLQSPFSGIVFNLSHSADLAIVAVSEQVRLGIDLESRRRKLKALIHAAHWLHPAELRDLRTLTLEERQDAFLRLWCRKEAVLKAEGSGLRFPLHSFRVSAAPHRSEVVTWPGFDNPWKLYDIPISSTHVAALAVDKGVSSIRHLELS